MIIKEGSIVKGKVTGVQSYGAFVKINDGVHGLVHISEISDGFVKNVNDFVKVGDVIKVLVLELDKNNQAKLSLKRLKDNKVKKNKTDDIKSKETVSGFKPLKDNLQIWIEKELEKDTRGGNISGKIFKL